MPVTFNPDALRAGLATITAQRLYCTWALEPNPANPPKPKKVPYVRGGARLTGSYADANLPAKLMTLNESIDACEATGHCGVGIVFFPGCGVVGLDLDHCIDPVSGFTLQPAQQAALQLFKKASFVEFSQSGTGLHAIALGKATTVKANGTVELFANKNFLALTGAHGRGTATQIDPDALAATALSAPIQY